MEITSSSINKVDNMSKGKTNNNSQDNIPILFETKKNKKINKEREKEKISNMNEEADVENEDIVSFQDYDEEKPLGEGEILIASWSF